MSELGAVGWNLARSSSADVGYVINMGNSIIGVSILAMPWCFQEVGVILATVLLIFGAFLTKWSCRLLLDAASSGSLLPASQHSRTRVTTSYELLALDTSGKWAKFFVEISTIGYLLGACIAFLVVMGDLMPQVFYKAHSILFATDSQGPDFQKNQTIRALLLTLIALCVALPLSLFRKVESLTKLSAFSLLFYILLGVKVFIDSFRISSTHNYLEHIVLWQGHKLWAVLPVFTTGLSCQQQVFVMYESLPDPSPKRMFGIISDAVTICFFLYWGVGFFGYVAFYDVDVKGDILLNLESSLFADLVKTLYVVTAAVSFPLCIFPCRRSVESLFLHGIKGRKSNMEQTDGKIKAETSRSFTLITVILVTITLFISIIIPNIETILNLSGSTMGALICFILPAVIAFRSQPNTWTSMHSKSSYAFPAYSQIISSFLNQHWIAVVVLLTGAATMAMCLYDISAVLYFWGLGGIENSLIKSEDVKSPH